MPLPAMIKVTPAAMERVKYLIEERPQPAAGLRLSVSKGGCSGLSYRMEFADEIPSNDDYIKLDNGATIYIDPKAAMFLFGTEMDYVEDTLQSGFVFNNPNEKGRCGCGESFYV